MKSVLRIHSFPPGDPKGSEWRIVAVAFFNIPILFYQNWLENTRQIPNVLILAGAAATLYIVLFFLGPALGGRSFFQTLAHSFGTIPARALAVVAMAYLVAWCSSLVSFCYFLTTRTGVFPKWVSYWMVCAAVVIIAFFTGGRAAGFTMKLVATIFIAGFIRAHKGWGALPAHLIPANEWPAADQSWIGLNLLAHYVAPLAFLATVLVPGLSNGRQIVKVAAAGILLPITACFVFERIVGEAALGAGMYSKVWPGGIAALFGGVSRQGQTIGLCVMAVACLGAIRFGVRALDEMTATLKIPRNLRIAGFAAAVFCGVLFPAKLDPLVDVCARFLVIASAVITVDAVISQDIPERKINWISSMALVCGLVATWMWQQTLADQWQWRERWLLPSYGIAFLLAISLRIAQKQFGHRQAE